MSSRYEKKPDHVVDFRGSISSIALLEMSDKFKEMKKNQVIELLVKDKETVNDIFKILPKSSYTEIITDEGTFKRIRITKTLKDS